MLLIYVLQQIISRNQFFYYVQQCYTHKAILPASPLPRSLVPSFLLYVPELSVLDASLEWSDTVFAQCLAYFT